MAGCGLALALALGLPACQSAHNSAAPVPAPASAGTADAIPEPLPELVARVNQTEIGREEFERAIRAAEIQARQAVPSDLRADVYRAVLDRLVAFHLLIQESRARDVLVDDAEVEAEIAHIQSAFPSIEAFEEQLSEWQTSLAALQDETRKDLLVSKVIEQEVQPKLTLDEAGVREFYDQHNNQFTEVGAMRASHILISVAPGADDDERQRARSEAEGVLEQARGGADFATLARQRSGDEATAAAGGDLGFVAPGQTVPPFEESLFALEPGDLSNVVESEFGFHIIQARENRPERALPFEEVSGNIRMLLLEQMREALTAEFIDQLKADGSIEIYI